MLRREVGNGDGKRRGFSLPNHSGVWERRELPQRIIPGTKADISVLSNPSTTEYLSL